MKMKQLSVLVLMVLLIPWQLAIADTLCPGWWNAGISDLQAARNQLCEIVNQPLSDYGTAISGNTMIFLDGWKNNPIEELNNALVQIENQIIAMGGSLPIVDSPIPTSTPSPTYTPSPTITPSATSEQTQAVNTDPITEKYSIYAIYALREFFNESWKNPQSIQLHGISVFVFPKGFEKKYENSEVDENTLLFAIDFSAQNGFGGMNRHNYIVRMLTDCVDNMRSDPNYDSLLKVFAVLGAVETDSGWIPKLYREVNMDVMSERKRYDLDIDYILEQYRTYEFEEWL